MDRSSVLCLSALALALACSAAGSPDQSVGTEESGGSGGCEGGASGVAGIGVPDAGSDSDFGVDITVNGTLSPSRDYPYLVLAAEPATPSSNGYAYVDNLRPAIHCN